MDQRVVPFPAHAIARYRAAGMWGTRTIAAEFQSVAARYPDRDAVVTAAGRTSYRELDERTDRVAAGLVELGLRPGDPVLFQVTNRLETVAAWYGVLKAGLVPVCTLAAHRANEIGGISRRTGAVGHLVEAGTKGSNLIGFAIEQRAGHPTLRHVLTIGAAADAPGVRIEDLGADTSTDLARKVVDDIQARLDPDDVAVFQLSGGTTGVPKVIPRLHAEYWYNAREYARSLGWDDTTRTGHLIPIIHNAGIVCGLHGPHSVGGCLVLTGADLAQALPTLTAQRTTDVLLGHGHYGAVTGPAFAALAGTLRRVVLSGAKVPPELFARLEAHGVWGGQLFGMGEGFFALTRPDAPREARLTTVGTPMSPLDEFKVLHVGTETELPDGQVGELCCAGPYTLRGYFDAPEQNRQAFTSDGFYRTGDLVAVRVIDGERYLSVEGRIKDLINRGGEKVSAEEVELLLVQHPRIAAAAVVAMPDPRLGERACAFLVARGEPLPPQAIQEHLAAQGVAKFKWPERLEWRDELPTTSVNKIDKKALRVEITATLDAEQR